MKGQPLVPQFDPTSSSTEGALIIGNVEVAIPNAGATKYAMISVSVPSAVQYKVGLAGVDASTDPHGFISLHSGPIILNVAGQAAIDFESSATGAVIVTPLSNQ